MKELFLKKKQKALDKTPNAGDGGRNNCGTTLWANYIIQLKAAAQSND